MSFNNMFFSPLGKLAGKAIYFACVNFFLFFDRSENNSQDLLDRFSQSFHRMKAFLVAQMIDHCHGNQFCKKWQTPLTRCSGIPKQNGISLSQCAH